MCCRVGTCCFITDLRLATILISVLSLLGNVGVLAFTSWSIKVVRISLLVHLSEDGSTSLLVSGLRVALALLAFVLVMSIAAVLLDVVLFFGAFRRQREKVQCWSHGHAIVSGAYLLYFWMLIVGIFANGYILTGFMFLLASILGAVLSAYFWIVVRSFDHKLYQMALRTVSRNCDPSNSNFNKPLNYDPPPYMSNP